MALDTFSGLYNEVLDHQFGPTRYTQYAKDKCNEAQLKIAEALDLEELNTQSTANTSAGTGTIALPSNFLRMKYVYDTTDDANQIILQPIPDGITLESFDRLKRGRPAFWFVQGTAFVTLYPIPGGVYNMVIRYFKKPTVMVADGDVPEVPTELRPLIVSYAVAMCYRREGDLAAYQSFMADFKRQLQDAAAVQDRSIGEQPVQVPGMW